eukprot:TRINITY_DN11863_c0_g1_i5.p2 TRINITY_DN11863_c0_g1~~TRINITY_DN11863_c0_g1_i5.p2  ORF type:complete len:241 (+),score=71.56 TRINITY_DN11863_c0_g1_i5:2153-2875(+)
MNCHLAHGKDNATRRFEEMKTFFATELEDASPIPVMSHDIKFMYGDLNFRIDLETATTCQLTRERNFGEMLSNDQLLNQSHQYNLPILSEAPIAFPPTYKFIVKTSDYNLEKRPPAWCDRILWVSNDAVKFIAYDYVESLNCSDHKPIYGVYLVNVQVAAKRTIGVQRTIMEEAKVERYRSFKTSESCNIVDSDDQHYCPKTSREIKVSIKSSMPLHHEVLKDGKENKSNGKGVRSTGTE